MAQANTTATGSINLLPQIAEAEIKTGVYKQKVNVFSIGALLLVFVVVAALFGYQLFLATRADALQTNTTNMELRIQEKFPIEIKQRALVEKLEAASSQLTKNKSTSVMTGKIIALAEAGKITLTKVDVDYSGGVSVSGKTPSSTNIGTFIDGTTDEEAQKTMEKVVASSVIYKDGNYQFIIRLNYTPAGLLPEKEEEEIQ